MWMVHWPRWGRSDPKPSPLGEGGPAGPDEGQLSHNIPLTGGHGNSPLISPRAGPRTASPPEGEAIATQTAHNAERWCIGRAGGGVIPSLPLWGKVAPQGRMRGNFPTTSRLRAATVTRPSSVRGRGRGQLPPKGEATATQTAHNAERRYIQRRGKTLWNSNAAAAF